MPYKMNAQSFARCETNKAFINVQRMHDSGRTESAQGRTDPNDRKRKDA